MALSKANGSNTIYLSVADGYLVRSHKEANSNTTQRVTKNGKLVHEEKFKDLIANLISIETKENEFAGKKIKQWALKFQDGEDIYIVNMPYSSRYAASFLKALPNIDLTKNVKFMPWSMADKNNTTKQITGVTMYQNDGNGFVKVQPAFTKDAPNGLPQMKQVKVKGDLIWDDSDMMNFLENVAKECFAKIAAAAPSTDESGEDLEDAPF
jgi:hypothetical protein